VTDQVPRVLIADDHPLFRDGLRGLLESSGDAFVVGEAADGDEAVRLASDLQPDIVLMDLNMPGTDGIEATRTIVRDSPRIAVLVVTMFEDDESVFAALRAGARGYLLKGANQHETLRALHAVANGEAIFGPGVAQRVMSYFATPRAVNVQRVFPQLSQRELEVLALIAHGATNQAIADELVLSLKTVRNHVSNICGKLQVADRTQAVIRARDAGLG
jgi:DNA-binding NarL/FixJ family response regulator